MLKEIKIVFEYRQLILAFLVRGFKAKYKNSYLGILWSLLNPLLNVLIFAFIFSAIIKIGIKDYPLYLLCAIFPWNFFNSALINSIVAIAEDAQFVKNTFFPVEIIPLTVVLVNFINFIIDLLILSVVLFLLGRGPSAAWLYLPFLLAAVFFLTCGLSILASGLYVIFRDLNFILNIALRLFFYFVPVIYTLNFVPENIRFFYMLNPLAATIDGFTKVFLYGIAPDLKWLGVILAQAGAVFIFSFVLFQRLKRMIPERL